MKILLIEDQQDKKNQIKKFLDGFFIGNCDVTEVESLRGALREVLSNENYECILLDMTMPYFDPDLSNLSDTSPESFAGMEFLEYLKLRNINFPVIVITQYSFFEGGVTLESLSDKFSTDFEENFIGTVYFDSSNDKWKSDLSSFLSSL